MTLIDKAEALAPCPFCGGGVSVTTTERVGGIVCDAPSECIGSGLLIVFDLEDMETALAAWNRRALPARGVGVRPLVWVPDGTDSFFGNGLFNYHAKHCMDGHWKWSRFNSGTWYLSSGLLDGDLYTEEAAKAAAQADYEARILAALHVNETPKTEHEAGDVLTDAAQAREAALHPDDMLPEAIQLIRQEATRDHSQEVVTGLKHIALLLEQLTGEART